MSSQQQYRQMNGEQLAQQARQVWQQIGQHVAGKQSQHELDEVTRELANRVEFVTMGKTPEPTAYSGLNATALSNHARAVVGRVGHELPFEQREQLDLISLISTLAERIEVAGTGPTFAER